MAQTARSSRYRFALGKQASEGTAQGTPAFEYSLASGALMPEQDEKEYEATDVDDLPLGYYKSSARGMTDVTVFPDVDAIGLPWVLHLGSDSVSGASDYTHTITRSYTKGFVTPYGMRPEAPGGTDRWERQVDGFVKAIEVTATKGEPLMHKLEIISKEHQFHKSAPTPTTNARLGVSGTDILTMNRAVLKLDLNSTPASTTVRNIENVAIRSEYPNAEWIQTDELTPRYLDLGIYRCGISGEMVMESYAAYAQTFFGSATVSSDMTQSEVVVTGSLDFTFNIIPTTSATKSLQIQLPAMRFTVSPPEPSPGGEAVRFSITGAIQKPTSGEAVTVVLKNQTASY